MASDPVVRINLNLAALHVVFSKHLNLLGQFVQTALTASIVDTRYRLPKSRGISYALPAHHADVAMMEASYSRWILLCGFRDIVEATHGFLEQVRECAALLLLVEGQGPQGTITGADWNREAEEEATRFHKAPFPTKIDLLRSRYRLQIPKEVEREFMSANRLRNCLAHRGGLVGAEDLDATGALTLAWRRHVLSCENDGHTTLLVPPCEVPSGARTVLTWTATERRFALGEPVELSSDDFVELAWAFSMAGIQIAGEIDTRARSVGVLPPLPLQQ